MFEYIVDVSFKVCGLVASVFGVTFIGIILYAMLTEGFRPESTQITAPKIVEQGELGDDVEPKTYLIYEFEVEGSKEYGLEIVGE